MPRADGDCRKGANPGHGRRDRRSNLLSEPLRERREAQWLEPSFARALGIDLCHEWEPRPAVTRSEGPLQVRLPFYTGWR